MGPKSGSLKSNSGSDSSNQRGSSGSRFASYNPKKGGDGSKKVTAKVAAGTGENPRGKKDTFKYKAPIKKAKLDTDVKLGFGGLVRYLIIFAIIIILIVVIGGQVLSASKEID